MAGLAAGIMHLFNHALMKAALFLAMGCAFSRAGAVSVEDLAGLGRRMPVTMAAFVVGGLSLIGVPLTVGFVTKWYLVQAALEAGAWPVGARGPRERPARRRLRLARRRGRLLRAGAAEGARRSREAPLRDAGAAGVPGRAPASCSASTRL